MLTPQGLYGLLQDGNGPAPLEHGIGCPLVGGFERVARFCIDAVQRNQRLTPTAALGMRPFAFVGEKVLQAHEKKRTELPGRGLHASEGVSFQESKEEFLREVLSFRRA